MQVVATQAFAFKEAGGIRASTSVEVHPQSAPSFGLSSSIGKSTVLLWTQMDG